MPSCTLHSQVHELVSIIVTSEHDFTPDYPCSRTIVPYVISPTSALGGSMPTAAAKAPLKAFRSSSSKHVSTTKRKIGGTCAGRDKVYSIVVYFGSSSGGKLVFEISL